MALSVSFPRFLALKRAATRRKRKSPDLSRSQILDQLAIEEGFGNWSLLARAVIKTIPEAKIGAIDSKNTIIFRGVVRSNDPTARFSWTEAIESKYPERRYKDFQWAPKFFEFKGEEKTRVEENMLRIKRAIAFMDATGLRTSRAFVRVFGRNRLSSILDHPSIWRDDRGRYIVTAEPYHSDIKSSDLSTWCEENNWSYAVSSNRKVGIWNPCLETCTDQCPGHTLMAILAPPKNGGDVIETATALGVLRA